MAATFARRTLLKFLPALPAALCAEHLVGQIHLSVVGHTGWAHHGRCWLNGEEVTNRCKAASETEGWCDLYGRSPDGGMTLPVIRHRGKVRLGLSDNASDQLRAAYWADRNADKSTMDSAEVTYDRMLELDAKRHEVRRALRRASHASRL